MLHANLENLKLQGSGNATAETTYLNRTIGIRIEFDTDGQNEVLNFASNIVLSLAKCDSLSKQVIAKDLLDTYNEGWNEYDEVQEDGSLKPVHNPKLNAQEFISKFELSSINICGTQCVEFWYGESDLFWGHSVFVGSLNGLDLSNASAELFG